MNRSPPDRQRAELAGRLAEWLALCYLTLTGHRLLARHFQSSFGEIDLVVRRRKVIIFCEVKFRHRQGDDGLPSPRQRRRICRAARDFIRQRRISPEFDFRIDLIRISRLSLRKTPPLNHLRDAWWCDQG